MTITPTESLGQLPFGDGSNKIFGMENFGNTCYCNSILQCLYYTEQFRTQLVMHNNKPHNRRVKVPGIKPHGFTTKYEQLVAKKLKEQGKQGSGLSGNGSSNGSVSHTGSISAGSFSNGAVNNIPRDKTNGSIVLGGSGNNPLPTPPASSSNGKRGSIFGIKFGSSNTNTNNGSGNGNLLSATPALDSWESMKKNSILDAAHCEELSAEQQILIRKNPDFQKFQLLVTRPPVATALSDKMDYSQSSSMLLPNGTTNGSTDSAGTTTTSTGTATATHAAAQVSGSKSIVVVGIPYQEPLATYNPNPSSDQRKRAALINGPIVNLDCSLQLPSEQHEQTTLLYSLRDMFESMIENQSQIGVVSPMWFITKLKEKNYLFRQNNMHHDAHEFCNYLINDIIECIDHEQKNQVNHSNVNDDENVGNWCKDIFKGLITNETKCLSCETITSKDESFLDLSVDIPPGESSYSLTHSLNNFSKLERLTHQNKFYCNNCCSLQEATKTIKIKKLPEVLVINFKRFKYDEKVDRMVKLFDSISYSHKLRLFNTKSEKKEESTHHNHNHHQHVAVGDDFTLYELYALVVHIGGGPMHGHYVSLCKVRAKLWLLFDDETVELVDDLYVMRFFGDGPGLASAYILFYRKTATEVEEEKGQEGGQDEERDEFQEEKVDFGFNVDDIYHGADYSLTSNNRVGLILHSIQSDGLEEVTSGLSNVSTTEHETVTKKASGLFKKNFKLDNFIEESTNPSVSRSSSITSTPTTNDGSIVGATNPAPANTKKSWVGGIKRRESKADNKSPVERNNSVVSESSVQSEKRKSFFGFKKKSKD